MALPLALCQEKLSNPPRDPVLKHSNPNATGWLWDLNEVIYVNNPFEQSSFYLGIAQKDSYKATGGVRPKEGPDLNNSISECFRLGGVDAWA